MKNKDYFTKDGQKIVAFIGGGRVITEYTFNSNRDIIKYKSKDLRKQLDLIRGKGDGTYDRKGNPIEHDSGYQASFFTTDSQYSDSELERLVAEGEAASGSDYNVGNFGDPEISFNFKSKKEALDYAKKYNQFSIWDWKSGQEIENPDYDPRKGNKL